jgi:hypothetical protein
VAGFYRIEPRTLLEEVVGLATMRGQLEPVRPDTFNPSGRSMAYTKQVWSRAGGWPEWIDFSEDTLFDLKMRRLNVAWRFAEDAVVSWRPRSTLRGIAKQFYAYGTGRGHTQIGAADFVHNLRNVVILLGIIVLCLASVWIVPVAIGVALYFYVWTFHGKAIHVAWRTGRWSAYPLCLLVVWITLFSNLAGYLVGSVQRWKNQDRYRDRMEAYLDAL